MEKHLVEITATVLEEDKKQVEEIIDFHEKFIADTITSGKFENVRVRLFGIFKVNLKKLKKKIIQQASPDVITQKPTQ